MKTLVGHAPLSSSPAARRPRLRWLALPICLVLLSGCGAAAKDNKPIDLLSAGLKAQAEGRTDDAKTYYQAVLAKDASNKYALYDLGLLDQLAGTNDSAEQRYRTALQTDPNFTPALYNLAILRTGPSPKEAVDLYHHVISLLPTSADAHLNLGFLLISMKQQSAGKAELDRAVALDPVLAQRVAATLRPTPSPSPSKKP